MLPRTPTFRLDGRRAVVTGAGHGIGVALSAALAQAGAEVTLLARSAADIERVAADIVASGGTAQVKVLDVLDVPSMRAYFAHAPVFDVLVNNAGTNRPMPMQQVEEADYDAVLNLNLRSAFFVAQAVARRMIDSGTAGSLIHVGSQMGHVGGLTRSLYCASKWGLECMNKALALDLAQYGIRSNVIAPTFVETPMTAPFLENPAYRSEVLGKIKLGRLGRVEDLMGAAVYLAGDAASLVTGSSLVVDGGWTSD